MEVFHRPPEGGPKEHPDSQTPRQSDTEFRQEQEQRKRQEALDDLVQRKRADNTEEAEQYLEKLNDLKESVVRVVRKTLPEMFAMQDVAKPLMSFQHSPDRGRLQPMTPDDLARFDNVEIDRNEPRVWYFSLTARSDTSGTHGYREGLQLALANGPVTIFPRDHHAWLQLALRDKLAPEQFELLRQEYTLTTQDLVRNLHQRANYLAENGDEFRPPAGLGLGP